MNIIYSKYNLERLRLQHSQLDIIQLDRSEMKRGTGKNAIRKVFGIDEQSRHEYDIYEKQQLDSFKKFLDYENQSISDELILRFLYANQFDFDMTIQVKKPSKKISICVFIIHGLQIPVILGGHQTQKRQQQGIDHYIKKQGAIYISGRGLGFKPIVVINADKLDMSVYPIEEIIRAISIVFMVVKDYMLASGKVESWFVIVEAKNTTAYKIPFNHLNQIFDVLRINFPCYLERVFILQPQTSIQIAWQIVEQFIPHNSRHKVEFIDSDYSLLFNYIKPKQLEQRHGGRAPNVYDYWPPHIEDFNEVEFQQKQKIETQKIKEQINVLQKVMPFSSNIDATVSDLLRKQYKPKSKIYQQETYLDTTNYFVNKSMSNTRLLNGPKKEHVISNQSDQQLQQTQKTQELNISLEQSNANQNNQQGVYFSQQPQQQQTIPFQSRFVGSRTKSNETQGSLLNATNQNALFQSRFVGLRTQHLVANKDISIIANRDDRILNQLM